MPMMMALALMGQTATLEADTREAALTCAASARVVTSDDVSAIVLVTYFTVTAASVSGPIETLLDRSSDDTGVAMQRLDKVRPNAAALLTQCRTRFPKAFATTPATLPTDSYERRVMCSAIGTVLGVYMKQSDPEGSDRMMNRYGPLVPEDELVKRGITDQAAYKTEIGRIFLQSLKIGNFQTIVRSCDIAFPG